MDAKRFNQYMREYKTLMTILKVKQTEYAAIRYVEMKFDGVF